jgi:hypothetical protein
LPKAFGGEVASIRYVHNVLGDGDDVKMEEEVHDSEFIHVSFRNESDDECCNSEKFDTQSPCTI